MRNPIRERQEAVRRLIVLHNLPMDCHEVYACRKVDTMSLLDVGWAEIVGEDYIHSTRARMQAQAEMDGAALAASSPEERKRLEQEIEQRQSAETLRLIGHILNDRARVAKLVARCDAWIAASVEAIGIAKDGAVAGILPKGTAPRDVCLSLHDEGDEKGPYVKPVTMVLGEAEDDHSLSVSDLHEDERIALGVMIQSAFSRSARVTPLRR